MGRTIRTIAVMLLGPPLILYLLAQVHILLSGSPAWWIATVLIAIWIMGVAALRTSRWRTGVIILVGAIYTFGSASVLPLMALSASCAVGPCL